MNDTLWAIILIILAIVSVRWLGGMLTLLLLPAVLVAIPGATMAPNGDARTLNPAKYRFGVAYACVSYYLVSTVLIAAVVGYSHYIRKDHQTPPWLVWPFGFFLATIPMYHAASSCATEGMKEQHGIEGANSNEAMTLASNLAWFLSYPTFIIFALVPGILHTLYGWLPWTQYVPK